MFKNLTLIFTISVEDLSLQNNHPNTSKIYVSLQHRICVEYTQSIGHNEKCSVATSNQIEGSTYALLKLKCLLID